MKILNCFKKNILVISLLFLFSACGGSDSTNFESEPEESNTLSQELVPPTFDSSQDELSQTLTPPSIN